MVKMWALVSIAFALYFGSSLAGTAQAKSDDHCIDAFQEKVFQLQPGKTSSVRGYPVAPASRDLLVPNASDIPSSLLTCAVAANDQMALLIRGRQLLAEPASAEDVVEGLRLISMAAYPQNQESIDCRIVTRALGYSCPTGLPEAHLEIGRLFANCKSDLYQPTLAKQHLSHALLSGARGASEAIADLERSMTRPIEAGCTRSPR